MNFMHKKFFKNFFICFVLLIIFVGCSKQEEKWIYTVSSKIIDDKNKIEKAHPDIDAYQNMAVVELKLTSMFTTDLNNLNIYLDFPKNSNMKLFSQGSSSSSIVKRKDKIECSFDIIWDQPLDKTRDLLNQSKIIIEWEQNGKNKRFEIILNYPTSSHSKIIRNTDF